MVNVVVEGQWWQFEKIAGKGLPIVVLHGWGRDGREWLKTAKELKRITGRTIYLLDLPGFGGSKLTRVRDLAQYAETVAEWAKYMKIPRMTVLGHSLGGRLGIILASRYQNLVDRLVLIAPAGIKPKSWKRRIMKMLSVLLGLVPLGMRRKLAAPFMDEDYQNSSSELRELYRVVVRDDLRKYLPDIKQPTDVIWGETDPILPLALVKTYRKLLPHCRVRIVWGAGHDPHLSDPTQLTSILEEIKL